MNTNEIMHSLAEYMRIADETAAIIDGLKDQLKAAMLEAGTDTIIGAEHKASYKTVVSSRIDTAAPCTGNTIDIVVNSVFNTMNFKPIQAAIISNSGIFHAIFAFCHILHSLYSSIIKIGLLISTPQCVYLISSRNIIV